MSSFTTKIVVPLNSVAAFTRKTPEHPQLSSRHFVRAVSRVNNIDTGLWISNEFDWLLCTKERSFVFVHGKMLSADLGDNTNNFSDFIRYFG